MIGRPGSRRDAVVAAQAGLEPHAAAGASVAAAAVPAADLVNVLEFEAQARLALSADLYARIAGGDRAAFDRMTLRPRVMVPTTDLDLGLSLFGQDLYAPLIVAPLANQRHYHADAERATVQGAAKARTAVVLTNRTADPVDSLARGASPAPWFQVFASDPGARAQAEHAVNAGCRVVVVTVGATWPARAMAATRREQATDWRELETLARALAVPVVAKGVMTPESAHLALRAGAQGVVVSNYGARAAAAGEAPVDLVRRVVERVDGRVPVLVDGGFRRGTDVLKALALGARAVLIGRPILWALSAYGAAGVTAVLDLLHFELARYMCMVGAASLESVNPDVVRVHPR